MPPLSKQCFIHLRPGRHLKALCMEMLALYSMWAYNIYQLGLFALIFSLSPEGTFLSDFVTKVDLSLYSETVSIHPSMAICQFAYMG